MKNSLLLLGFAIMLVAQQAQADPLIDARARYVEGEYEQAAKLFEQAIESTPPHAAIFFELGQCLKKIGQDARAALNFQRALILDPRWKPAQTALQEVNTDLGIPQTPQKDWKDYVLEKISLDSLTVLGTFLFWLGLFMVTILTFLHLPDTKKWIFLGAGCLVSGTSALTVTWLADPRITDRQIAMILTTGGSPLLDSPIDQAEKITSLPEGSTIKILSQRGRWFYGQLPNGQKGWLLTQGVIPLIPPD